MPVPSSSTNNAAYILEDRTGSLSDSDFDDMYDRKYLRISSSTRNSTVSIFDMGFRSSRHHGRGLLALDPPKPSAVLEFTPSGELGYVSYHLPPQQHSKSKSPSVWRVQMDQYLTKSSMFSRSWNRRFTGLDGQQYRWAYSATKSYHWTCTLVADGTVVAHYDLKPQNTHAFNVSGNMLIVYEPFAHLAVELLASLTIMRHIEKFHL